MTEIMTIIMTGILMFLALFIALCNALGSKAPHGAVAAYWICVFLYWIIRMCS